MIPRCAGFFNGIETEPILSNLAISSLPLSCGGAGDTGHLHLRHDEDLDRLARVEVLFEVRGDVSEKDKKVDLALWPWSDPSALRLKAKLLPSLNDPNDPIHNFI